MLTLAAWPHPPQRQEFEKLGLWKGDFRIELKPDDYRPGPRHVDMSAAHRWGSVVSASAHRGDGAWTLVVLGLLAVAVVALTKRRKRQMQQFGTPGRRRRSGTYVAHELL